MVSSLATGNSGLYTNGSCVVGYGALAPGARLVYRLSLGAGVPLGGTLTLSTCGLTSSNTALYLGTGCPTASTSFNCLVGNDDAAPACASNALASTLKQVAASSVYFVQVGAASGGAVVSGLSWSYAPPSPSATPSRSRSRSSTATASRSRSATASKSRSRKAKRAAR